MTYFLAVGPHANWAHCFEHGNVWGFSSRYRFLWGIMGIGDTQICYATRPIQGVIGYCTIRSKSEEDSPFFPQETQRNFVLWPLRVTLVPERIIPQEQWATHRVQVDRRGLVLQRGLGRLAELRARDIMRRVDET